jgi:hypothetical protein
MGGSHMTQSTIVHSDLPDSEAAGAFIGDQIAAGLNGAPDAVLLFTPPNHDYGRFVKAVEAHCHPKLLVGGCSVGGFTSAGYLGPASACAVALRSPTLRFSAGIGRGLGRDPRRAAVEMVAGFEGIESYAYMHRSAIVLIDALVGHADQFIDEVILATGGVYQLFGGGTADGARMSESRLFCGTEVLSDAAVALEILSDRPLGVGLCQGWVPTSERMRVTEAEGNRLIGLNGVAALEIYQAHAEATGQAFDHQNPIPFFLDNIIGIESGAGYKFRVPVAVNSDRSITCAAEVPTGAMVRIMATTAQLASQAAAAGVDRARQPLNGSPAQLAIFFDCLASQARMQLGFGFDPGTLSGPLNTTSYVGFSTCGQIVRSEGEFNGFQNCTAVVCLFPQ